MSAFHFMQILQFSFTCRPKQGAKFLSLLFDNLYLSEPLQAETDIVETNFGFQLAAPSQQQENLSDSDGLGKVETLKESLLKNKTRIFSL